MLKYVNDYLTAGKTSGEPTSYCDWTPRNSPASICCCSAENIASKFIFNWVIIYWNVTKCLTFAPLNSLLSKSPWCKLSTKCCLGRFDVIDDVINTAQFNSAVKSTRVRNLLMLMLAYFILFYFIATQIYQHCVNSINQFCNKSCHIKL